MKKIFEPIECNHLKLRNRLVRSATWEGIARPDGSVTDEAFEIYENLAKGGVGAIITGFTSFQDWGHPLILNVLSAVRFCSSSGIDIRLGQF